MQQSFSSYHIFPLGDTAITIDFGNRIDEQVNEEVIRIFNNWKQYPLEGVVEIVPAYSSLTVYYDPVKIMRHPAHAPAFEWIKQQVHQRLQQSLPASEAGHQTIRIPVCYDKELAPDLLAFAATKKITTDELISLHTTNMYRVYMLGFLPGFSYMGEVDEKIAAPRKSQPVHVAAGSVGIAGRQTGIYPMESPGGWQIIGRTPLQLFDSDKEQPTLLKMGDHVQFYSISIQEYGKMIGSNRSNMP